AGSTWEEDEIELLHFVNVHPDMKFIIAPHEIDQENLDDVKDEFPRSIFYSELVRESAVTSGKPLPNVLIIDNVGMLSRLYKYATIAYVGGGFGGDGVHNVLEAAVYGKPVVFGPVYDKFDEVTGLLNAGGGLSIDGPINLEATLINLLNDEQDRVARGVAASRYVQEHAGASKKIIQFIQENRLLTS
ncbi:MAG TPA: 3-deoxy-D-manno-octulosonic acid transferase, partial [Ferruginibacter sp.]|nr:3-deoxy-D-manno-octulosonic acid transferase [Ferruginibacter sp.]